MVQTSTDSKSDAEYPHGTFGNVLHALTFGIFGNQKGRLDKHVESEYKVKAKSESIGAPNDYHPEEEFQEETFDRQYGNHYKLLKVKKTEQQKQKEAEEAEAKRQKELQDQKDKEIKEKERKNAEYKKKKEAEILKEEKIAKTLEAHKNAREKKEREEQEKLQKEQEEKNKKDMEANLLSKQKETQK